MSEVEQTALIRGSGNLVIQAGRDVNLAAEPRLHLTRYETRRGRIDSDADRLTAYARAIAMIGRDPEMEALSNWLGSARPIAVRVLTGPAGSGKTRLALELVDRAIADDWDAGFVTDRELARFAEQENLAAWGWRNPTLIVVDYAAARAQQLAVWLAELADNPSVTPLRLLLIERHADPGAGWWREAFGRGSGDALAILKLLDPAEPVPLPSLGDTEVRREILGAFLAQVGGDLRPPERGADPDFDGRLGRVSWGGEPLFLQMAGVLAADSGFGHVLTLSRADLAFALADREIARIEKIATAHAMDATKDFAVHMAAYATLCQGLTRDEALPAIAAEKTALLRTSAGDPPQVFNLLASALPGDADAIAPVLPDMIGEAVLLRAGIDADAVIRAAASHRPRVAATVMRTAQDYAPQGELAPLDWFDRLVEAGAADLAALMEIADALPWDTLVFRTRALELFTKIAEIARAMPDDGSTGRRRQILAAALNNLANRLSDAGKREEALDIAREAVALYRDLAAANPDAFTPDLAMSLNNLAVRLSESGKREEALDVARQAVELRRTLAAADPDAFTPDLATSLNNLAPRLSEAGKREEALDVARQAVELRRTLAAANPDAFTPDLATSLNNLANRLREAGKREEALDISRQAVELQRALAAANPDAFTSVLATALNNLATMLRDVGKREEALDVARQAVELRRTLAAANPDAFTPNLATSLSNLAPMLSEAGKREEALDIARQAVSLYRTLAAANPDAFTPDLATSLNNLAPMLREAGKREEALDIARQAVELRRTLTAANSDVFTPNLARSLSNLATMLSETGKREEALDIAGEAVSLDRALAAANPDAFTPDLAMSLNNLAAILSEVGKREEAFATIAEAVQKLTPHFRALPAAHRPLMEKVVRGYLELAKTLGREPDPKLLEPVAEIFARLESQGHDDDEDGA